MTYFRLKFLLIFLLLPGFIHLTVAQQETDSRLLTLERIHSNEFSKEYAPEIQWIDGGEAYVIIEKSESIEGADELVRYESDSRERSLFISAESLQVPGGSLAVESFSLSPDGNRVLIFTNSSRVWRSNTKGDYWVYNLNTNELQRIGRSFEPSSLMFAKFSKDSKHVFYVHDFNIYRENFETGEATALTTDGNGDIINGTFDWVYEEELGKRDGFTLSPNDEFLAFWRLDASDTGTFYMINNTDSIYSRPIPVQYPKVGEKPSRVSVGLIDLKTDQKTWIPFDGDPRSYYIPGVQWVNDDLLLIQQLNRHQNELTVWTYVPSEMKLKKVYVEKEETFVDLMYPDLTSDIWSSNDLTLTDDGASFLRMTETDAWRHIYKVGISDGQKLLVTPFDYDIASMRVPAKNNVYYVASPENGTQRYLYQTDLKGKGKQKRLTPAQFEGVNNYQVSPNGKYAVHTHQSALEPATVRLIGLPDHKTIRTIVDNDTYKNKLSALELPKVRFMEITTEEGIEIDARLILPKDFDPGSKYPVLFHVYGEPWGQVATDTEIGLWNIMMAQKGYVIIDMDNRGTPCLKGSAWRKSIYRQVGRINARDQGLAAKEILKLPFLDESRTAVWGWSGGGSMTLNLMFKFPEVYTTGVAIAAVSDQRIYDNIYQERYMGLPQENPEDFIAGSPITYAKNLQGNLLLIHGTADDNVHYQSAELLINELIARDKQFKMMSYPNRSHSINEGENTRKHLFTLITNYIIEHVPAGRATQ